MTCGKCDRCGAEDSMFWYPYAFGVAPIPDIAGRIGMDRSQYFNLCDTCQCDFVKFMSKTSFQLAHPYIKEAKE